MKHPHIGLAVLCIAMAGCHDGPTSTATGLDDQVHRSGKSVPATDSVLLAMRVIDDSLYRVGSDGLGEYQHGVASMIALIDASGNLQISPMNATGTAPAPRRVNVRYASSQRWTFPRQINFKIKSNRTNNGNPRLQDMAVGSALCYNVTIAHRDDAVQLTDTYNPAAYPSTSYAMVTRVSQGAWVVTSQGVATTGLDCGVRDVAWITGTDLLVKRGGAFTVGNEVDGFRFELRALP